MPPAAVAASLETAFLPDLSDPPAPAAVPLPGDDTLENEIFGQPEDDDGAIFGDPLDQQLDIDAIGNHSIPELKKTSEVYRTLGGQIPEQPRVPTADVSKQKIYNISQDLEVMERAMTRKDVALIAEQLGQLLYHVHLFYLECAYTSCRQMFLAKFSRVSSLRFRTTRLR